MTKTGWATLEELQSDPDNFVLRTAPHDPRFPQVNQTKNCWQNYVDYHKCINKMGKDYEPCEYFKDIYRMLCPSGWIERWDEALAEGKSQFVISPLSEDTHDAHKSHSHHGDDGDNGTHAHDDKHDQGL